MITVLVVLGIIVLLLLLSLKTWRCDGTLVKNVHPYRKVMCYLSPRYNDPIVYYDNYVRCDDLVEFINDKRKEFPSLGITHCVLAAGSRLLFKYKTLNRFVSGHRLYQRNGVYITFSMKRKMMDQNSKMTIVKLKMRENESFKDLCSRIDERISYERTEVVTSEDRDLSLLLKFPRPFVKLVMKVIPLMDYYNLLPRNFIEHNGLFTSAFVVNLGSIGLNAGYHHLFEWGNCPCFLTIGKIEETPVVENGEIKVQKMLHFRWTFDERIDDALSLGRLLDEMTEILENPYSHFTN